MTRATQLLHRIGVRWIIWIALAYWLLASAYMLLAHVNVEFDLAFMDELIAEPDAGCLRPHTTYIREAGSEGIELVMWFVMRGVLDDEINEVFRMHHVPTSNTSNGLLILQNAQER